MKKFRYIFFSILFCIPSLYGAGTRDVIMLFDWGKETVANDMQSVQYAFQAEEFGPVTQLLLTAISQKAAPIIVSASVWRNAVERGKIFYDIARGHDISYLKLFPMLKEKRHFEDFWYDMHNAYDQKKDLMKSNASKVALDYFTCYQFFFAKNPVFKHHEWIVKKLSDYMYVLVPTTYLAMVQQRKDTPSIVRNTTTKLTLQDRLLGMKLSQLTDISSEVLLDPHASMTTFNYAISQQQVSAKALGSIRFLKQARYDDILAGYFFGQHVVHMLPKLFITRTDLKDPKGNADESDINEALFLHEWLVYLNGHGSTSSEGPVRPVVEQTYGGFRVQIAYMAGLESGAFRDLLGFFNTRVYTGALLYTSCYSGGHHLFTLFEHHWDYPVQEKRQRAKPVHSFFVGKPDVFNYLIIATNMFYTPTSMGLVSFMSTRYYAAALPRFVVQFGSFFGMFTAFLHQRGTVDLVNVIKQVHTFNFKTRYQMPAIRFPNTQWFVPLDAPQLVIRQEDEAMQLTRAQRESERTHVLEQFTRAHLTKQKELKVTEEPPKEPKLSITQKPRLRAPMSALERALHQLTVSLQQLRRALA